jgi:hypothetical protein
MKGRHMSACTEGEIRCLPCMSEMDEDHGAMSVVMEGCDT